MSSTPLRRTPAEAWLVMLAFFAFTLWYAKNQLLFSLYFGYQIVQFLFPHWLPRVGTTGK